jgi:hypothetical protein
MDADEEDGIPGNFTDFFNSSAFICVHLRLIPLRFRGSTSSPRPHPKDSPNEANDRFTKRTVMTIGMLAPPHENGRGPGGAEPA